jgi:general secretion pathway protein G
MKIQRKNNAFTLVEILIVVIILGILAAIVIPQFTEASEEARESTLTSNLQVLRSQVGLYKIQHRDNYPDSTDSGTFETAMTSQTDEDGVAFDSDSTTGPFGPYMQQIPLNPFSVAENSDGDAILFLFADPPAATDGSHWNFDSDTGAIVANDGGVTPGGTDHEDL